MQVTLLYFDRNHTALGRPLEAGDRLLFGKGERADLLVSGDDIADVHFSIENDGRLVWVHPLVDAMAPVLLNERPVEKSEVDDGDTVAAGNTKVRVQIRDRDRSSVAIASPQLQPAPASSASEVHSRVVDRELPTGLVMYQDPDRRTSLATVLEQLLAKFKPMLLANFRSASQKPPEWLAADDDLLAAAPAEITAENSLYLIAPADVSFGDDTTLPADSLDKQCEELLKIYHSLRPRAAVILALVKTSKAEVLKSIGFRRGFYCSLDGLEMFLRQGSRELAHSLIAGMNALLIARAGDTDWTIYANPSLAPTIEDLGLTRRSSAPVTPTDVPTVD